MATISVATFNVLAQSAVHWLHADDVQHLAFEHRAPLLARDLSDLMGSCAVVALQEVCSKTSTLVLEHLKDFDVLLAGQPSPKGLANWLIVGSTNTGVPPNIVRFKTVRGIETIGGQLREEPDASPEEKEAVALANKPREMPWAVVDLQGKRTLVACFHLPLELQNPRAMELRAQNLVTNLLRLASQHQAVVLLLGDLNCLPDSQLFQSILTMADLEPLSAPAISCWNGAFQGCLDYVLATKGAFRGSGGPIREMTRSCPNQDNGSDHVPVVVNLDSCLT